MSKETIKRKKLHSKLFTKNRLVILNEDTFEETFSLKLTLMNVFGSEAGDNYHYSITTLSLLLPLASIFQDIPPQNLKKMLQY
jgi:hypothetical protein